MRKIEAMALSTKNRAKQWLRTTLFPAQQTFSSAGEDRLSLAWLRTIYGLDLKAIRYCDIGASHPKRLNNTFALYQKGGRGVLVEPNPEMVKLLRRHRPRDTILNVGAAFDEQRSAKLIRFTLPVFNTFSIDQAQHVIKSAENWPVGTRPKIVDEVVIPLVPLNDILSEHFADGLHFLSIDAEGVDLPILKSIDLDRFKPKMICIESSSDFDAILQPLNYRLIARTPDNVIYAMQW